MFQRLVEKGRVSSEEAHAVQGRIRRSTQVQDLSECDVVVEAIVEDLGVKSNLFQTLETVVSHDAVLATNTSSLSVTALARACEHPSRVVGLHFFNPAPLMALVEVVPALQTQPALADYAMAQMQSWGKAPALAKDTPGFIVNRVARPFYSEALRILVRWPLWRTSTLHARQRIPNGALGLDGPDWARRTTSPPPCTIRFTATPSTDLPTPSAACGRALAGLKNRQGFYIYVDGVKQGDPVWPKGR